MAGDSQAGEAREKSATRRQTGPPIPMDALRTSWFRRAGLVAIVLVGVFVANNTGFSVIALLLLFGVWNAIYLFVVPRARQTGGVLILFLSLIVFAAATEAAWATPIGLALFAQANWLAFTAAARLDD